MRKIRVKLLLASLLLAATSCGGNARKQTGEGTEPAATRLVHNEYVVTRTLGDDVKVTWIQDNATPRLMPRTLFADASDALIESLGLQDGVPASVSVFLIESDGKRILVDAGNGTPDSRLPAALETLKLTPADIQYIYVTHFHGDHIGGMLSDGNALFPNARLYVSQVEHDAWKAMPAERNKQAMNLLNAYKERLHLFADGETLPGKVTAVAAPGHTPGHTAFRIGEMLIVGDLMHGVALQQENPEICASFDMDKTQSIASRKAMLEYAQKNRLFLAGMHFPPSAF